MRPLLQETNNSIPFMALVLKREWKENMIRVMTPPPSPQKKVNKRKFEIEMGLRRSPRKLKRRVILTF
jgi:hypothetical protein